MSDPSVISDFWGISDSKTGKYVGIPIKIEPPRYSQQRNRRSLPHLCFFGRAIYNCCLFRGKMKVSQFT